MATTTTRNTAQAQSVQGREGWSIENVAVGVECMMIDLGFWVGIR